MTLEELLALLEQAENAEALGVLTLEEADALRTQLQDGYDSVRPGVSGDGIEALRRVVAAITTVDARITELQGEAQTLEDELAELDLAVHKDKDQLTETPSKNVGSEGDTAGTGEAAQNDDDKPGSGRDDLPQPGSAADTTDEPAQSTSTIAVGNTTANSSRPSLDALNMHQRRTPEPTTTEPDPNETRVIAGTGIPTIVPGTHLTADQLGSTLQELHRSLQTLTEADLPRDESGNITARAAGRKVYLGTIPIAERPGLVHMQKGDGSEVIDQAVAGFVDARDERLRKLASGGDCVMALPDYSIKLIGDRGTCFTDDLPTVASNRPLAYYPWLQIDQSAGATGRGSRPATGIGFVTSEQDAAGYGNPDAETGDPDEIPEGGVKYKDCIHIDCPPEPLTCNQEAVYKCVTLGNFQAISHPEYVAAFQTYMDIWFDIERDTRAINAFLAEATAQTHALTTDAGDLQFGAVSSLKDIFNRIVAKERSARHAPGLGYNIVAPDWFGGFLALDIMRHTFGSLDNLRVTAAEALALASTDGIRVSTYCTESRPATTPKQVLTPNTTGVVPDWPDSVRLLMYPDGAVFKKTAGDLRFGLRETLMKTNDFGMFQEAFEKVCFRGPVYTLDVRLCPNGATGAPVALTCT